MTATDNAAEALYNKPPLAMARYRASVLRGDVVTIPLVEGAPPENLSRADIDWPSLDIEPEDLPRLAVLTENFHFLSDEIPLTSRVTVVTWWDSENAPHLIQIGGPADHGAIAIGIARKAIVAGEPIPFTSALLVAANSNPGGTQAVTVPVRATWPGIISSGELVKGFVPPDYAIDGIVQSGFLYSVTASTGTGKTAILLLISALTAQGEPLGTREVRKGRVVYFAGENPSDVTMRWIGAAHNMGFDPTDIDVHFVAGTFDITKMFAAVAQQVNRIGGADLVVIDTSAAYFQGGDENANAEMGKHARNLRMLTELPGAPCVLVACHPTKNADQANLLPRGGGAFIAEMDGNLTCQKTESGTVKMHWQGKHRGPDFKPVYFDLKTVTAPQLVDTKGRDVPTVMASVVSDGEVRTRREEARKDEDQVLIAVENLGAPSANNVAEYLIWTDTKGEIHKKRAHSALNNLRRSKLVELTRDGWVLTKSGQTAATAARQVAPAFHLADKIDRTDTERTGGYS